MKLAILNSKYVADEATLKAIDHETVANQESRFLDGKKYVFFQLASSGIKPDSIIDEDEAGRWVYKGESNGMCYIVEDDYDFVTNDAKDLSDTPENAIKAFSNYAYSLVGSAMNFKDYMCLRAEIKSAVQSLAGNDYANYATLSADIRDIASIHVPTKILDNVGIVQLITDCAGDVNKATTRLADAMKNNDHARKVRYAEMVNYAYQKLGKTDGLSAEEHVLNENLRYKYVNRGVMRTQEDGLDGLVDWLESVDSYVTDGLKKKIEDGNITIKDGTTTADFIARCVDIVENGKY